MLVYAGSRMGCVYLQLTQNWGSKWCGGVQLLQSVQQRYGGAEGAHWMDCRVAVYVRDSGFIVVGIWTGLIFFQTAMTPSVDGSSV